MWVWRWELVEKEEETCRRSARGGGGGREGGREKGPVSIANNIYITVCTVKQTGGSTQLATLFWIEIRD